MTPIWALLKLYLTPKIYHSKTDRQERAIVILKVMKTFHFASDVMFDLSFHFFACNAKYTFCPSLPGHKFSLALRYRSITLM